MVKFQDGGSHEQETVIYQPVCNVAARLFDGCTHAFKVHEFNYAILCNYFVRYDCNVSRYQKSKMASQKQQILI